jgi:hypothetical protein
VLAGKAELASLVLVCPPQAVQLVQQVSTLIEARSR